MECVYILFRLDLGLWTTDLQNHTPTPHSPKRFLLMAQPVFFQWLRESEVLWEYPLLSDVVHIDYEQMKMQYAIYFFSAPACLAAEAHDQEQLILCCEVPEGATRIYRKRKMINTLQHLHPYENVSRCFIVSSWVSGMGTCPFVCPSVCGDVSLKSICAKWAGKLLDLITGFTYNTHIT